jgi:hypothetical protein
MWAANRSLSPVSGIEIRQQRHTRLRDWDQFCGGQQRRGGRIVRHAAGRHRAGRRQRSVDSAHSSPSINPRRCKPSRAILNSRRTPNRFLDCVLHRHRVRHPFLTRRGSLTGAIRRDHRLRRFPAHDDPQLIHFPNIKPHARLVNPSHDVRFVRHPLLSAAQNRLDRPLRDAAPSHFPFGMTR